MKFKKTPLDGAFTIEMEPLGDERGFFGRIFCSKEFTERGIEPKIVQANNSRSAHKYTLRGLHYQLPPMQESKLVRCIKGSVYDVILDIRPQSKTFGQSFGAELTETNRKMMFVPKGFAHGFLTLTKDSEVIYFVSEYYSKEHERGIRWNDPSFSICWPEHPIVISQRDQQHPNYSPEYHQNHF
ncbi:MAG: dTDP-4-dehydrorhamnose 3,5-epimerase [Chlamydiota bacterium]|nr:dTDP-4-dehydrorhamnose 3,5-epimerase [Chlamydiota bacterium]